MTLIKKHFFLFTLIVFAVIGVFGVDDYGLSVDEAGQRNRRIFQAGLYFDLLGLTDYAPRSAYEYDEQIDIKNLYYGTAAQYPLFLLEYLPHEMGHETLFYWRLVHLYLHALFLVSAYCFYKLLGLIGIKDKISVFVSILYLLYPRIYAHSFYNIKDTLFLSLFVIATYLMFSYDKKPSKRRLFAFSIFTALAINTRVMGVLIPVFYVLWTAVKPIDIRKKLLLILRYGVLVLLLLHIIWPLLWYQPLVGIFNAFIKFSKYDDWNSRIIFNGNLIKGSELPFYYIPVWIAISSPLNYLAGWLGGLLTTIILVIKYKRAYNIFPLFVIIVSYVAIIVFNSTLYGDWRHVYFIYPSLMLLYAFLLQEIYKYSSKLFYVSILALFLSFSIQLRWMITYHPNHYVYFNVFAGDWDEKWDRDYWRVSLKPTLEALVDLEKPKGEEKLKIYKDHLVYMNSWVLPPRKQLYFSFVDDKNEADYIFYDYRFKTGSPHKIIENNFINYLNYEVEGKVIMSVYKKIDDKK